VEGENLESRLWNSGLRRLIPPALVSAGAGLLWGDTSTSLGTCLPKPLSLVARLYGFPATFGGAEFVRLLDIFPDRSQLLVGAHNGSAFEAPLWVLIESLGI
jgi:hypothetical protein